MSATFDPLDATPPRASLATASLPRRVRRLLEQIYAMVSDETAPLLERMLAEFEQQLFRQADQARNPGLQSGYLETLRLVRLRRSDLIPRFLLALETSLTGLRAQAAAQASAPAPAPNFRELRLVEESEIDEHTVLRAIAARHESRAGLGLLLLGQRFGVLAGAPAYDAERLPVGPHRLVHSFAQACQPLQIQLESRLDLYRVFDQQVMLGYAALVESINALLARENVLPGLSFVPLRLRPAGAPEPAAEPSRRAEPSAAAEPARADAAPERPHHAWLSQHAAHEGTDFATLQRWLAERRELLDKLRPHRGSAEVSAPLATADLLAALQGLRDQRLPGAQAPRRVAELRQSLLALGRGQDGAARPLAREDADVIDLLDLLYGEIQQRLRGDAAIAGLLERLQAPLLQAALQDRELLGRGSGPALDLLNTVAEAGARWTPGEDVDPQLHEPLRQAVDHVVEHYRGSAEVFADANQRLQQHLQALARKAEVTERRHVEAARGKEKLELAKRRAGEAIESAVAGARLPRFAHSLLNQAWADVLTLTWLRHGEGSEAWHRQLGTTGQIVARHRDGAGAPPPGLDADIEHALTLVGYHGEDAQAIARQLTTGPHAPDPADATASRTELAMKLRARARLGEDAAAAAAPAAPLPPRDEHEQACWEQVRALPFGTWFEFVQNQQGDSVRRRLSWFSPVTDKALFVNQRGHRVGEQSLDGLARMLARGQARVVPAERSRLVDRAWHAALDALRGFGARARQEGEA